MVAEAFDMKGGFDDISLKLGPDTGRPDIVDH